MLDRQPIAGVAAVLMGDTTPFDVICSVSRDILEMALAMLAAMS